MKFVNKPCRLFKFNIGILENKKCYRHPSWWTNSSVNCIYGLQNFISKFIVWSQAILLRSCDNMKHNQQEDEGLYQLCLLL